MLDEIIERYQKQYDDAVVRNENSSPNKSDMNSLIEYYMSMSEYTTLECVLKSLRKLKGEFNKWDMKLLVSIKRVKIV